MTLPHAWRRSLVELTLEKIIRSSSHPCARTTLFHLQSAICLLCGSPRQAKQCCQFEGCSDASAWFGQAIHPAASSPTPDTMVQPTNIRTVLLRQRNVLSIWSSYSTTINALPLRVGTRPSDKSLMAGDAALGASNAWCRPGT